MPIYVKDTTDELIKNTSVKTTTEGVSLALKIGGIYVLLSIASGVFLFLTRQTIIIMSRLIEFDLKNEIYAQYQRLDYSFYKKNATGDLMNRISEDVSQVRMYLGPGIMYTINLIALFFLVIYQMVNVNPLLTLFVLIPLPIMSFLIYKVSSKMNTLSTEVQREQSLLSTIAQETFAGIRVVKAYSREKETHEKFNASSLDYKKKNMRLVLVNSLFMPTIVFLIGVSTILAIYVGGLYYFEAQISIGGILAFILFVNKLTWPFASLGWVTSINQRAAASQKRINEFLQIQPEIVNTNHEAYTLKGDIQFNNVSYTYPNSGIEALKNVSFTIKEGETFAIIGKTGSGKSTLVNMLMRQFDPTAGQTTINNEDLRTINLEDYRNQSGVVPQEVFLFSETIAENIRFGKNDELNHEEIVEAARKAHVLNNIEAFPDKFETILGERGVNLSGGQKQRISIARALIRHPKLLVLDDCLSAVDTETEEIILSNLKADSDKRTTVIVSHRISSIRNATKIIVLDHGTVIEQGSHEELMALNKAYSEMYFKQLAEDNT